MQFHQTPGDGQTRPVPPSQRRSGRLPGETRRRSTPNPKPECRFQCRQRKNRGILAAGVGDPDAAVLRGELHGVAQQVVEHLLETRPIGANRHAGGHLVVDGDLLDFRQRRDRREHFLQGIGREERFAVQIDTSGFDFGDIQEIVDDVEQVPGAFLNVGHKARVGRRQRTGGLFAEKLE